MPLEHSLVPELRVRHVRYDRERSATRLRTVRRARAAATGDGARRGTAPAAVRRVGWGGSPLAGLLRLLNAAPLRRQRP